MFGFGIGEILSSLIDIVRASLDFLAPLFAILITLLGWYFKKLEAAIAVLMSNLITLFAIVPLLVGTGYYSHYQTNKVCETKAITKLRKDYKFVPKASKEKSSGYDFLNPLGWWK